MCSRYHRNIKFFRPIPNVSLLSSQTESTQANDLLYIETNILNLRADTCEKKKIHKISKKKENTNPVFKCVKKSLSMNMRKPTVPTGTYPDVSMVHVTGYCCFFEGFFSYARGRVRRLKWKKKLTQRRPRITSFTLRNTFYSDIRM